MSVRTSLKMMTAAVLVLLFSFTVYAFADEGYGHGRQGKGMRYDETGCGGPGWRQHHQGSRGSDRGFGRGFRGNLSEEVLKQATEERDLFFEETGTLRRQIRQKKLELNAELAKDTPDAEKAVQIQTEISNLKADFDKQRVEHRLRMKKIHPELGQCFGPRGDKGSGGVGRGAGWNSKLSDS